MQGSCLDFLSEPACHEGPQEMPLCWRLLQACPRGRLLEICCQTLAARLQVACWPKGAAGPKADPRALGKISNSKCASGQRFRLLAVGSTSASSPLMKSVICSGLRRLSVAQLLRLLAAAARGGVQVELWVVV